MPLFSLQEPLYLSPFENLYLLLSTLQTLIIPLLITTFSATLKYASLIFMKAEIIAFINKVKSLFNARKTRMGEFHPNIQQFSKEISQDEVALESAAKIINQLDESETTFAASGMYYLQEKVVPIFIHWRGRLDSIPSSHHNAAGHIQANKENQQMLTELSALLETLNSTETPPLIPIETDKGGQAIVKAYNKEQYLKDHKVQEIKQQSSWHSNCKMQ